jgi:chromosome segregation ATPase
MLKAGVPPANISSTKDAVMQLGIDSGTADEKRRGSLVALFVNSGHVRLVQTDRRSTLSSIKTNSARSFTETTATTTSPIHNSSASMDASDATLLESKSISRKSKLEKITELQGEKSTLKKENKALKKTMKKLLIQLSESSKERRALKMKIEANAKEKRESETVEDSAKGSLHSVDHDISVATDTDSRATRRKESSASQRSRDVSVKDVSNLKKMMKKQRQEHESTEFRLKAEIEILTKEVDGLQRELSLALESADDAEKRVDESHEAASKLKRKMRTMSSKLIGLTEEANARDKLIEAFTKLLVDKNGGENGVAAVEGKLELAQLIHTGS